VALILYEIHWTLPPFVLAGLLAYIVTTAIDWASARSRLIMSERRRNFLRS
jgi:predicted PurR-regulated permease PerM